MNIAKMMQQAKVMQEKMAVMQDRLGEMEVTGTSGGGLIKVTMTCKGEVRGVEIDESLLVASEKEVVEDLMKAALNDGKIQADTKMAEETQAMMGEMGLPAGTELPM